MTRTAYLHINGYNYALPAYYVEDGRRLVDLRQEVENVVAATYPKTRSFEVVVPGSEDPVRLVVATGAVGVAMVFVSDDAAIQQERVQ